MNKKLIEGLKNKKALFFDYDGTLVDNEKLHFWAHKENLKLYGFCLTQKDFVDCCICRSSESIMTALEERFKFKIEDREKFWNKFLEIDLKVVTGNDQKPFSYVAECFEIFKDAKKIVITNESDFMLSNFLKAAGINLKFDCYYSCFQKQSKAKTLQNLKQQFGVDPCDAVLFEDSQENINAAKKAGILTVGVRHKFNKGISADFVL